MARNSEKAVTALARWRNMQLKEQGKLFVERRPHLASEEKTIGRCEKWRNQVIREIAKKVSQIQNAGLGEFKLRDLNDEINKLLREKGHWEDRINELGGPNYRRTGPKLLDKEGQEVPGSRGYKYFGAAKNLPGVKELFDTQVTTGTKKSRAELMREIDAEYYGYLDDEDYLLLPQEELCEKEARQKLLEEFKLKSELKDENEANMNQSDDESDSSNLSDMDEEFDDGYKKEEKLKKKKIAKQNTEIPSIKDIELAIIEKKKKELLSKYVSDELMKTEEEAKILSGNV